MNGRGGPGASKRLPMTGKARFAAFVKEAALQPEGRGRPAQP